MQVEVFERSDETLMIGLANGDGTPFPRSCGPLVPLGTSDVDEATLHPFVVSRLRIDGCCAVVGDDATRVRMGMAGFAPEPVALPAESRWLGLIG